MTAGYFIRFGAFLALFIFSLYMAHKNEDARTRKKWKSIIGMIAFAYFCGKLIDEFKLF